MLLPPRRARYNVVQRQITRRVDLAAVLAGVAIADKDVLSGAALAVVTTLPNADTRSTITSTTA